MSLQQPILLIIFKLSRASPSNFVLSLIYHILSRTLWNAGWNSGNLAPVCCWCENCKVLLLRLVDYASYSLLYIKNNGGPALLCIKHAMSETIQTHEPTTTNHTTLIIFRLSRASPSNFALSLPCTLWVTLKCRLKCSLDFILNEIHPEFHGRLLICSCGSGEPWYSNTHYAVGAMGLGC